MIDAVRTVWGKSGRRGSGVMIHGDATAAALEAVLDELGAAEDRAARAGHALAELEERAEEDPAAAAGLGACHRRAPAGEEGAGAGRGGGGGGGAGGGGRGGRPRGARGVGGARKPLRDDGLSDPAAPAV